MKYKYIAQTLNGEQFEGINDFNNPRDLLIFLNGQGVKLLSYTEYKEENKDKNNIKSNNENIYINKGVITGKIYQDKIQADIAKRLYEQMILGYNLIQAIKIVKNNIDDIKHKQLLIDSVLHMENGNPWSEFIYDNKKYYSVFMAEMIYTGEQNNNLTHQLKGIQSFFENENISKKRDMEMLLIILTAIFMITVLTILFLI